MSMDTAAIAERPAPDRARGSPPLAALAFRDLRGGLRGFYVFIACLALGVAVIAGVGALADAMRSSFTRQGATLLGGDAAVSRPHRRAESDERAYLARFGRVAETATLRAMARRLDGNEQVLVELKGVDRAYPLLGALRFDGAPGIDAAIRQQEGIAVDPILLERLGVKVGDRIRIGANEITVRATITAEPDKIADRLTMGPRVLMSLETLQATGLVEPGSLVRWRYAIRMDAQAAEGGGTGLDSLRNQIRRDLPQAGFTIVDRRDPSPQVTRTLDRTRQFLTLVGLTALLVGGVGVANAVAAYIDRRRKVIAIFKSLGASTRTIFAIHLIQVLTMAAIGIVAGLLVGLLVPGVIDRLVGDALPIKADLALRWTTIASAGAYGLLVALLFTLWPLGRAEHVRASVLFRDEVAGGRTLPGWPIIALTVAAGLALLALAVLTSDAPKLAFYFCAGIAALIAIFWGLGTLLNVLARRAPRSRRPALALATGSLGAPGGLTRSVVLSLGSGLSLLVAVSLVDASIVGELESRLPANSPTFFVLDVPRGEVDGFEALVRRKSPDAHVNHAPMLRGRIVRLGGRSVEEIKTKPEAQWVLNGDRGLSYADEVPEGSTVVAGSWWPKGYEGPPLVSFEADLAKALGVGIGDTVTINVLGRDVVARIANLREVRWESLAINFVMVFSPNTLAGAPHNVLATVSLPAGAPLSLEADLSRAIAAAYPATTAIRVKEAINAFQAVFSRIMTAVRAATGVTLLAGALVLAGALATSQRRRLQTAVILKALGATRRQIMAAHFTEYALLATATTICASLLGALAAFIVVGEVMELPFVLSWMAIAQALVISLILVALLGAFGTWRVLAARPVPLLRAE